MFLSGQVAWSQLWLPPVWQMDWEVEGSEIRASRKDVSICPWSQICIVVLLLFLSASLWLSDSYHMTKPMDSWARGSVLATFAHHASVPWLSYQIPGSSLIPRDMLALLESCFRFIPVPWGELGASSCLYQGSPEKQNECGEIWQAGVSGKPMSSSSLKGRTLKTQEMLMFRFSLRAEGGKSWCPC